MADVETSFEREVIGAMLKDAAAWEHLSQVHPSDFSTDNGRILWGTIADLVRDEIPVSVTTVADQLGNKLESVGGREALLELHDLPVVMAPASLAHCAAKIRGSALGRRIKAKSEAISLMNGAALADVQQAVVELAEMAAESVSGGAIRNLADIPSLFALHFPDPCFAVPDVLPYQRVTVLAGQSGSGKTYLMLAMAIAVATGGRFLGRECMQMPVLILDRENSGGEMRDRIRKMAGGDVPGIRVWGEWLAEGPPDLADPRLLKWAELYKPLIIADSLGQFLEGGDEKEITDIAKLFQPAHRLKNMGATIGIIAHVSDKPNAPSYRGHSSIKGNTDLLTILTRDRETGLLTLKQDKHRGNPETTMTIRADFSTGEFEQTDSPIAEEKRNNTDAIREIIAAQPSINQTQIGKRLKEREAGIKNADLLHLLTAYAGKFWRYETHGIEKRYFIQAIVPIVPIVPGTVGTGQSIVPIVPSLIRGNEGTVDGGDLSR